MSKLLHNVSLKNLHTYVNAMAQFTYVLGPPGLSHNSLFYHCNYCNSRICRQNLHNSRKPHASFLKKKPLPFSFSSIICSVTNRSSSDSEISSAAKIRSEVLSPFRSVRMFFYLAFIASAALGGLIATTQLIAALTNSARAAEIPDIIKGLGIDLGAVSLFGFLYYRENKAKNAQLAKLTREESLSNLRIRVHQKRVISVNDLRGIARLVICAGPASFITESFKRSEPFTESLLERGVLVVSFATDGNSPSFEFEESEEMKDLTAKRKKLWQLGPVSISDWSKWLDDQKKLAGISPDSPVYLSLRMDGRVRGSGVGYPPWNAFVAQLPPVKGIWSGLLDGMDGRVL